MPWIIAGAALAGGALSAGAASSASKKQQAAAQEAIDLQRQQMNVARADLTPARQAGDAAVSRIRDLLGIGGGTQLPARYQGKPLFVSIHGFEGGKPVYNPEFYNSDPVFRMASEAFNATGRRPHDAGAEEDFKKTLLQYLPESERVQAPQTGGPTVAEIMAMDPGYQFRLGEGEKALTNRLSAMGLRNSGAALKAGIKYNQNFASDEYNNIYNRLAGVAGLGQNATNTGVGVGANYAGNVGNLLTGSANARGAAAIAGTNAWGNALNTIGGYYGQKNLLDQLIAGRSGGRAYAPSYTGPE